METVIISGGSIDRAFAGTYIRGCKTARILAADAGLVFCRSEGILPDLILGDFDSADGEAFAWFSERYPERIRRYPAEKDETDTELALREAIRLGSRRIVILGGTGTRLDHVLGNVQLLKQALDAGIPCVLLDAHNRIRMIRGTFCLQKKEQFGTYVSLIPFTETVRIRSLRGFAYNVTDFVLRQGMPVGVSNEITGEEAVIDLEEGIALLIESRD